jgi:hypothetical protein
MSRWRSFIDAPFLRRDQTAAASSTVSGSSHWSCETFWRNTRSASGSRSFRTGSSSWSRTDSMSSEIAGIEMSAWTSSSATVLPVKEKSPSNELWKSWKTASSPVNCRNFARAMLPL